MHMKFSSFAALSAGGEQYEGSPLHEQVEFGDNPANLRMFRYVPDGVGAGAPLVVILHGCLQTARGYDHGTGWSTLAERFGFALLAPEQNKANNLNGCFNWFVPEQTMRGGGEVASIRQMIARMVADHRLDPRRIFISGLSAGGAMTGAMLADYPEIFAGGGIIAGLPHGAAGNLTEALIAMHRPNPRAAADWGNAVRDASEHAGPWPRISVWHGDADTTVAYSNMEAIIAQWLDVHGIERPPLETTEDGYARRVWRNARREPVIEAYAIKGLGHGAPIRPGRLADCCGEPMPFILDAGISSSYRIASFFGLTQAVRVTPDSIGTATVDAEQEEIPVAGETLGAVLSERADAIVEPAAAKAQEVPQHAQEKTAGRIQAIITKALTAAGLIRR
jgi:poly(hydroxyalkanoate) depolymerase family esterase